MKAFDDEHKNLYIRYITTMSFPKLARHTAHSLQTNKKKTNKQTNKKKQVQLQWTKQVLKEAWKPWILTSTYKHHVISIQYQSHNSLTEKSCLHCLRILIMSWLIKDLVVIMKDIISWLFKDPINSGLAQSRQCPIKQWKMA